MLTEKVVEKIVETGLYFDDELDIEQKKLVLSKESRDWFNENLGIPNLNSAFIDFYSLFIGGCGPRPEADSLFTLKEILENQQQPYWGNCYPNIEKKLIQLSSIEGEHSLFFEKDTDYVYSATWSQMAELVSGKLTPSFENFGEFLNWYFCV